MFHRINCPAWMSIEGHPHPGRHPGILNPSSQPRHAVGRFRSGTRQPRRATLCALSGARRPARLARSWPGTALAAAARLVRQRRGL
ncbi:hypothetical protein CBM2634_A160202 [Cupriavidus taiwanensis]|uniref:Uncharacterized protein n=1 Tax=Cupriavidus taiwanensis TaxID=164546 RepID=A0A375J0G5_9BURK|nr:hypothetical protein CBM2634_A160202 [Cupriavidus taiwanensis]